MPYLIDGHNLIPKAGISLASPDDEMELVAALQEFARISRLEVEVFFDGAPPGEARSRRFGKVTAHFVPLGATADAAIKARLKKLAKAARTWVVVTSDRDVQLASRAAGARVVSSEEFSRALIGVRRRVGRRESERAGLGEDELSVEEIEEWLRLFKRR